MTPWVQRLLFANIAMFFVQYVAGPQLTDPLVFVPALILLRPWSIVTYMFLHGGIEHILFNMIALYFFGPQVEARLGSRRFITLYLISGISGALLSFVLAPRAPIIGASAAIYGVMLAFAYYWPRVRFMVWFILPVEARWLVIGATVFSLWAGFSGANAGTAHFAHLGGFAGAYLYLLWMGSARGMKQFQRRAVGNVPTHVLANWKKVDPTSVHELNRDEVNRILDKISASGVGSLTPQEKAFLSNFVPPDDRVPPVS